MLYKKNVSLCCEDNKMSEFTVSFDVVRQGKHETHNVNTVAKFSRGTSEELKCNITISCRNLHCKRRSGLN